MSLKLLQPGIQPLGQFDGLDTDVLTLKGGEVVSFAQVTTAGQPGVTTSGLDQAAYDVFDGYINVGGTFKRPAVSRKFDGTTTLTNATRPLMLSDEGITGYGTLFGAVVGGTVGQQVNGPTTYTGAVLGPHTATGSGKCTCWDKPGLYAVSLDACDTTASAGLQPTNTWFDRWFRLDLYQPRSFDPTWFCSSSPLALQLLVIWLNSTPTNPWLLHLTTW